MNVTLIVLTIGIIVGIIVGYRLGAIKGLSHLVAMVVTALVLLALSMLAESFKGGQVRNSIMTVVFLVILGTIYGLIKSGFKSAKAIAKLPVLGFLDKILGMAIGLIWVFIFTNAVFILAYRGLLGKVSDYIINDIANNSFLTIITLYNPLM